MSFFNDKIARLTAIALKKEIDRKASDGRRCIKKIN